MDEKQLTLAAFHKAFILDEELTTSDWLRIMQAVANSHFPIIKNVTGEEGAGLMGRWQQVLRNKFFTPPQT